MNYLDVQKVYGVLTAHGAETDPTCALWVARTLVGAEAALAPVIRAQLATVEALKALRGPKGALAGYAEAEQAVVDAHTSAEGSRRLVRDPVAFGQGVAAVRAAWAEGLVAAAALEATLAQMAEGDAAWTPAPTPWAVLDGATVPWTAGERAVLLTYGLVDESVAEKV